MAQLRHSCSLCWISIATRFTAHSALLWAARNTFVPWADRALKSHHPGSEAPLLSKEPLFLRLHQRGLDRPEELTVRLGARRRGAGGQGLALSPGLRWEAGVPSASIPQGVYNSAGGSRSLFQLSTLRSCDSPVSWERDCGCELCPLVSVCGWGGGLSVSPLGCPQRLPQGVPHCIC